MLVLGVTTGEVTLDDYLVIQGKANTKRKEVKASAEGRCSFNLFGGRRIAIEL